MSKHTATWTGIALLASGLAAPANAMPQTERDVPTSYVCANGAVLGVIHVDVSGHSAVLVSYPNGRDAGVKATSLLPATQTGSGERYASDITEFHVKGNEASFMTLASAKSEAIERVECNRAIADAEDKAATQGARAGRYFVINANHPHYNRFETICFASDGKNFLALRKGAKPGQVVTYNSNWSTKSATVGDVDAGAGQRRYTLTSVDDPKDQATLHFIAPGMREADLPSATAGMSSVSQGEGRRECVDTDRIVYVGTSTELGAIITLEEDGLAFRTFGQSEDIEWPEMRGGYIWQDDDHITFEFLSGDSRVSVSANRSGSFELQADENIQAQAWKLQTPIAERTQYAMAYFIADEGVFGGGLPQLDKATVDMLASLSLCNHLSGEASEDAERNAELSQQWEQNACNAVGENYALALEGEEEGSSLQAYLKTNSPTWR